MQGFIQLHRQITEWEWYTEPNTFRLFIHCLLKANHKSKKWRGIDIDRGQFITSYETLSKETKLSVQNIRTSLKNLCEITGELTRTPHSQYTIITVSNYNQYQQANKQSNKQLTSDQQTGNKQLTTTNNDNNDNKVYTYKNFKKSKDEILEDCRKKYPDKNENNAWDDFVEYCDMKKTNYKNYKLAFFKWIREDRFNKYKKHVNLGSKTIMEENMDYINSVLARKKR